MDVEVQYVPRGSAAEVFALHNDEVILSGPAGTGKSRAAIEKLHAVLMKYDGAKGLIFRKTLNSLTSSGLVTYRDQVRHPLDGVRFFSGNKEKPAMYIYPRNPNTGRESLLVVGGMDNPGKVMSTEYDIAYGQECTDLTEEDWESVTTRLRNEVMPYNQLLGDCNPNAPHHWVKQRCDRGQALMLESRHEENPRLFTDDGILTEGGRAYMRKLDALTGHRLQRLRYGRWVAAEGIVYETYDRAVHLVQDLPNRLRYIVGVDWGFTNPGCLTVWGIDSDGRLYEVEEVYMTRKLMDWWVAHAERIQSDYHPEAFICDPSEPAFIAQFISKGLNALPAYNEIVPGIEAVQNRLQRAGDGQPRLMFKADCLLERDEDLADRMQPLCLDQEMDSHVWPKGVDGKPKKEVPVDDHNHALDSMRYVVCYVDHVGKVALTGNLTAVSAPRPQTFIPR